jgi:hypothetical protein
MQSQRDEDNDGRRLQDRVRFIACCLIAIYPTVWVANFRPFDDLVDRSGNPLGADYAVFYLPGRMVLEGRPDELYSHEIQQQALHKLFPALAAGDWLPFRYPPWVATAMAPLAALPYVASFAMFTLASLAALVWAWKMLARQCRRLNGRWRSTALLALLGWPVVWETLLDGQSSLFTLAILATTTALVDRRRFTAAGAVLALATFKPNVLAWFALGYVARYPRMLCGAIPVGLLLIGASAATVGWDGVLDYARLASHLAARPWDFETDATKVQGLTSWLSLIVPGHERLVLSAAGLISVLALVMVWRHRGDDRVTARAATSMLILVNTLCNPYVPIYDLTLLAAAAALLVESSALCEPETRSSGLSPSVFILAVGYFGPHVSQAVCRESGMQLFPLVLAAFTAWLGWRSFHSLATSNRVEPGRDSPGPTDCADLIPRLAQRPGPLR